MTIDRSERTYGARSVALALLVTVAVILTAPRLGAAATFTVDSTVDAVDANVGDGICATVSSTCSLRAAVQTANALASNDTITVPAGTYVLNLIGAPVEDNALTGDLDVGSSGTLMITGAGAGQTILDGNTTDRVLQVFGGANLTLTDITVRNGRVVNTGNGNSGGGIVASGATLTLDRCAVEGNTVVGPSQTAAGGGIATGSSTITIRSSTISGNTANNAFSALGGGIHQASGTMVIENSTISGNGVASNGGGNGEGGGMYFGGTVALRNVSLVLNIASHGGGGVGSASPEASLTLQNTIIAGNNGFNGATADDCSSAGTSPYTSLGYNLYSETHAFGCPVTGTDLVNAVPGLLPLGAYGGPTKTNALTAGSPAKNAGNPAVPGSSGAACFALDQRGATRPAPSAQRCDIGAYEDGCGNGFVDPSESCDGGSCCTATCTFVGNGTACPSDGLDCTADVCDGAGACVHPPALGGESCDDSNACTTGSTCGAGSGVCGGGTPVTCPVCEICQPASGCVGNPDLTCRQPMAAKKAPLSLKRSAAPEKNQLSWRWGKGTATTFAELGNPVFGGTSYTLCLFDQSGGVATVVSRLTIPGGLNCATGPCWKATTNGLKYSDKSLAAAGVQSMSLGSGAAGKAKLGLKAKGGNIPMPLLPLTPPLRVEVHRSDAGVCWAADYSSASKNSLEKLSASSD